MNKIPVFKIPDSDDLTPKQWALVVILTVLLAFCFVHIVLAQTIISIDVPCPKTGTANMSDGTTVQVPFTCSTGATPTPPPVPPPTPPPGTTLPAGYAYLGGDSARMQMPSAGTLAFGSQSAGWTFRSVKGGEFIYCVKDEFPGAPSVNFPSCYFKTN